MKSQKHVWVHNTYVAVPRFLGCHDLRDGGLGKCNETAIGDVNSVSVLESSSQQNMCPFTRSLTLYDKMRSGENLCSRTNGIRTYNLAPVDTRTLTDCIPKSRNSQLSFEVPAVGICGNAARRRGENRRLEGCSGTAAYLTMTLFGMETPHRSHSSTCRQVARQMIDCAHRRGDSDPSLYAWDDRACITAPGTGRNSNGALSLPTI